MRTPSIQTTLSIAILLFGFTMANAQTTWTAADFKAKSEPGEDPDYVTVGSTMPYKIHPFFWGSLVSFMDPSIYKWVFSGDASDRTLFREDGTSPLTPLGSPNDGYYSDSTINIHWLKTGTFNMQVTERSMPKSGVTGCDQTTAAETLNVSVLDRPTVKWNAPTTTGGCGTDNTTQKLAVSLKGSKHIEVTYDLVYTDLSGTPVTTPNQTATFDATGYDESLTGDISIDIPSGKFGKYEVSITKITDKISTKCRVSSEAADFSSDKFTIVALPNPKTSPIEHISNL